MNWPFCAALLDLWAAWREPSFQAKRQEPASPQRNAGPANQPSLVVQLRPHAAPPEQGDAIGLAVHRLDQPPFPQALEQGQRAIGQHMAFAGEAGNVGDLAVGAALMMDRPALGEDVEHALFAA